MRGIAVGVVILTTFVAAARGTPPNAEPDREIAQRHFEAGRSFYDQSDYAAAVREFDAARAVAPVPAFDFNIARCYDRMERLDDAIAAYRRYLDAAGAAPDADEVRARVAVLSARRDARTPPPRRTHAAPIAVGAGAFALVALGGGLIGWAASDYNDLRATCGSSCAPSSWKTLPARIDAGYALFAIGGALAAVDLVLWILDLRAGRRARETVRADAGGPWVTW